MINNFIATSSVNYSHITPAPKISLVPEVEKITPILPVLKVANNKENSSNSYPYTYLEAKIIVDIFIKKNKLALESNNLQLGYLKTNESRICILLKNAQTKEIIKEIKIEELNNIIQYCRSDKLYNNYGKVTMLIKYFEKINEMA